jgi:PII-like signaling protein
VVDALKLTVFFGERDRAGRRSSAEAVARATTAAGTRTAVLLRAIEGFGSRGAVHTERLLTLSEDLPLVWVAVDRHERIAPLANTVAGLIPQGLVTLERCAIAAPGDTVDRHGDGELKLTIVVGRGRRHGGVLDAARVVDHLRACGLDTAYVLVGVDGILHGVRHSARLIGTNRSVPALVTGLGPADRVAAAVAGIEAGAIPALMTVERARIIARDGRPLAPLPPGPPPDSSARRPRQMLTLITREDARAGDQALHAIWLRTARDGGASGATTLAGVWGFSGRSAPHGDSMRRLRRSVPVICTIIDTPEQIARLWPKLAPLARHDGIVTAEFVPALRAHGAAGTHGGLDVPDAAGSEDDGSE